jgi:hypothetical protein
MGNLDLELKNYGSFQYQNNTREMPILIYKLKNYNLNTLVIVSGNLRDGQLTNLAMNVASFHPTKALFMNVPCQHYANQGLSFENPIVRT